MIYIRSATIDDIEQIAFLGKITFLETYLPNTPKKAVEDYAEQAFSLETLQSEFAKDAIHYFLLFEDKNLVGYAKIELSVVNPNISSATITKLERLYVLKSFHGKQLGQQLFDHLVTFSKDAAQEGMWLYVLIKNERALRFYQRNDFAIVGEYDFKVSETHYNPNYVMYLEF